MVLSSTKAQMMSQIDVGDGKDSNNGMFTVTKYDNQAFEKLYNQNQKSWTWWGQMWFLIISSVLMSGWLGLKGLMYYVTAKKNDPEEYMLAHWYLEQKVME